MLYKNSNKFYVTVMIGNSPEPHGAGADPGEGHRGQMTPPSEPCQISQKMMYWYEKMSFKLLFLYFYKIKTICILKICTHHIPCSTNAQGVVQWGVDRVV